MSRSYFMLISLLGLFLLSNVLLAAEGERSTNFMNTNPSSDQLIEALKPSPPTTPASRSYRPSASPAKPKVRFRGLSIAPRKPTKVLLNIPFEFDSDELTSQARATLKELGKALESPELANQQFAVEGHTDSKGSHQYNKSLSQKRAMAVTDYLATHHSIARERLKPKGKGETEPFDRLNPEAGINRRVEVINTSR